MRPTGPARIRALARGRGGSRPRPVRRASASRRGRPCASRLSRSGDDDRVPAIDEMADELRRPLCAGAADRREVIREARPTERIDVHNNHLFHHYF